MSLSVVLPDGASLNGTSFTVPVTSGLQDGDYRIVCADTSGSATFTAPSGWTNQVDVTVAGGTRRLAIWSNIHNAAAPAGTSFTISASNNYGWTGCAVRGVEYGNLIDVGPTVDTTGSANATAIVAPSVTPAIVGTLFTFHVGFSNSTSATLTVPSGMVDVIGQVGTGTNGHSVRLCREDRTDATATGTRTSTLGVSSPWAAASFVVTPMAPPPLFGIQARRRAANY